MCKNNSKVVGTFLNFDQLYISIGETFYKITEFHNNLFIIIDGASYASKHTYYVFYMRYAGIKALEMWHAVGGNSQMCC